MRQSIRKRRTLLSKISQSRLCVLNLKKLRGLKEAHCESFSKSSHNTILKLNSILTSKFRNNKDARQKLYQKCFRVIWTLNWMSLLILLKGPRMLVVLEVKVDQSQWMKHQNCKSTLHKIIQMINRHLLALYQQLSNLKLDRNQT
jgi:hypothetical protein